MLKVKGERDAPLTRSRITRLRGRKRRNLAPVDPEAKTRTRKANTKQRRAINLKAAAKVEKKAEDRKVETSLTSIKVIEEAAHGAKMTRKESLKLITTKMETKATTLIKSTERKQETGRKVGQSPQTRKEALKMDTA